MEVARGDERRAARLAAGEHLQRGVGVDLLLVWRGVTAVRHVVHLVKAVREEVVLIAQTLGKHAKELGAQQALVDAMQVIQAGKGAPAQKHRGQHVLLRPVHDLAQLVPVVDLLERHLLHGRTRDDEAIVVVVLEVIERVVELHEVIGGMGGLVGRDAHEVDAHLDGRLRDEAQDLRLCLDLGGHEVEQRHMKRTNLLLASHVLLEGKDALLLEDALGGQTVGDVDGH